MFSSFKKIGRRVYINHKAYSQLFEFSWKTGGLKGCRTRVRIVFDASDNKSCHVNVWRQFQPKFFVTVVNKNYQEPTA